MSDERSASQDHPEPYYDEHGRFIYKCWCGTHQRIAANRTFCPVQRAAPS